jgi:TPR repeat protein
MLYYKGIGVDTDFKKAAMWFKRAADKGHAAAQYNLGIMSYLGQGVDQNYAKAAEWFNRAGAQDHAAAQYNLGFLYYEGKGVDKDDLQAYMWIDRSASLGDEKAIKARDTLQKALPKEIFNR